MRLLAEAFVCGVGSGKGQGEQGEVGLQLDIDNCKMILSVSTDGYTVVIW